ncbi:hypothetical protein HY496_00710 [Candidatus Woesearchaeota archaeon]|nr:hypothetical protein [Candidatus Woesearchaeota archaeon]
MVYHSLFDEMFSDQTESSVRRTEFRASMAYAGTLGTILDETERELILHVIVGDEKPRRVSALSTRIYHPPRIVRALVDSKVEHSHTPAIEPLLKDAISLGLDIYRGDERAVDTLRDLRTTISGQGFETLLERIVYQQYDPVTWNAGNPLYSQETAMDLRRRTGGEPIVFIALGHGGVAAGMDVFLRYCDVALNDQSKFYVVRFSRTKSNDFSPQVSPTEWKHIQELSQGRKFVVFDEDVSSGETINQARKFFEIAVQTEVMTATNYDAQNHPPFRSFPDPASNYSQEIGSSFSQEGYSKMILSTPFESTYQKPFKHLPLYISNSFISQYESLFPLTTEKNIYTPLFFKSKR